VIQNNFFNLVNFFFSINIIYLLFNQNNPFSQKKIAILLDIDWDILICL
jgi:hypothetical protein